MEYPTTFGLCQGWDMTLTGEKGLVASEVL